MLLRFVVLNPLLILILVSAPIRSEMPMRDETLAAAAAPTRESSTDVTDARDGGAKAMLWLEKQLGPPIEARHGRRARLIDSYEDDQRIGWIYDAAIAAIAFAARGRTEMARELLNGLAHLQNEDGSWEFAYDPDRGLAIEGDRYLGSIAWVVIAANFFEWETGDTTFGGMADEGLRFVDRFVVGDATSPLFGGVSMGPVAPQIYSTEHNVDAYSAFHWRGRLADRPDYLETASRLRAFILRELTTTDRTSGDTYFKVGHRESTLYLDPQTWTSLALSLVEPSDSRIAAGLDTAERRLRVTTGRLGAVSNIVGFTDAETGRGARIWSEGTEGMVAARLALGQLRQASGYHRQTLRMQAPSGGIPYASENADGWSTLPSVAGTAWFVLNHDWPPRNPFAPDVRGWMHSHGDLAKEFPLGAQLAR